MGGVALPPGAELVGSGGMELPPGAELVTAPGKQPGFLSSVWEKANPVNIARGVVDTVTHPLDSLKAWQSQSQELHDKAVNAFEQGDYQAAAAHGINFMANIIPGLGKAMDEAAEAKTPEEFKAKLGSAVGTALIPKVAEALPGMYQGAKGVAGDLGAAEALRGSAEKGYAQALNPTTKANKAITAKIVPELIDRGETPLTLKGLQSQAQAHIAAVGSSIGDAWDNLPPGTKTDFEPVYNKLQEAIDKTHSVADFSGKMIPKGPEAARAIGNIESLQQTLLDVSETDPATGKVQIPVDKVHSLKQYFDDIAARAGRYSGKDLADQSAAEAHGLAADAIREELANDHPDIAALNKEYSFWKNVNRVTSDTIERRQGQAKPLGRKLASAAGTAGGFGAGGFHGAALGRLAMDSLEAATTSMGWRTVSASLKAKLADAVASGNQSAISFYSQQALRGAGTAAQLGLTDESSIPTRSIEAGSGQ